MTDGDPGREGRLDRRVLGAFALLSYVPLFLTAPGRVAADTKVYLYTDPGQLIARAGFMWDPDLAAGTVSHQNIGYLFPMGPYYWLMQTVGVPDWIAQRLWLGTILLAAGAGTMWLLQRLGLRGIGVAVAGLVYMTSPYIIPYFGRTSALLLPWTALPWLIGLLVVALRQGGWRAPVCFALILTSVGGTNASSLVFVALGPLLWLPYAIWVEREVDLRRALATVGRLAATCIPSQLWWMAGLRMQGTYGLPILELTESVETVAQTASAPEIGRGMGYWYAYGRDGLSAWTPSAVGYTQHLWLIATSFAIPTLAMVSALFVRWRHRAYFVSLAVIGMVLGIGTYPYDDPPLFGWLVKTAADRSAAGLALRNTPRAVPLLVLATATLLGVGAQAAAARLAEMRRPALVRPLMAGLAVLAVLNLPSLWTGQTVSDDLSFPEEMPDYWHEATDALDATPASDGSGTRVLELPGSDFAVYRWGQTQDPIAPGLMERPWIGRELTAFGTPGTVDLLRALDRRLQEGVFDARAVAPVARLLAAGDVLWRSDTEYERYRGPRPRTAWAEVTTAPGLGAPTGFGNAERNTPDARRPMRDEPELGTPVDLPDPPQLAVFPVDDVDPIVRAKPSTDPLLVAGDGETLVDAAEAGLLTGHELVLYSASFADDQDALREALTRGGDLLLSDGNRRRAQRWGTVRENNGFTEEAGSEPLEDDAKDTRLEVFPDAGDDTRTVADYVGVADVSASTYGNIVAYAPERRPANAIDGDLRTSWQVGGFADVVGERLRITLDEPITIADLRISQDNGNRHITELGVRLDGHRVVVADMDESSFSDDGQRIAFDGEQTFREVEFEIVGSNVEGLQNYLGFSTAGLREVHLGDVHLEEVLRVPTDLLDAAASTFDQHDLTVLLSRWRADPAEPFRADPEPRLIRSFALPSAREFAGRGQARIESRTDGAAIDAVLGRAGTEAGHAVASGTDFLAGSVPSRPSSAIDGDPTTAWTPNLGDQVGRRFDVALPRTTTFRHLDLTVTADGWHSVPTQLTLELADGGEVVVDVPPITDLASRGDVATVPIDLPAAVTTSGFGVRVSGVRDVTAIEYFSGVPQVLPVSIAELGIAGVQAGPLPDRLDAGCRMGLLTIDGRDVGVRLEGSVADAVAREAVDFALCGEGDLALGAGEHIVRSADGIDTALAIDRVVLESAAPQPSAVTGATDAGATPTLAVDETGRLSYDVDVRDASAPFWLVLGQSQSPGWKATIAGDDLGESTLVDGYANGWLIDPAVVGPSFSVSLQWTPQRTVWAAVVVSAIALLVLAALAVFLLLRRPPARTVDLAVEPPTIEVPWAVHPDASTGRGLVPNIAWAAALAVVAWAVGGVVVGVVVGAVSLLALLDVRLRAVGVAVAALAYPLATAWYGAKQFRNEYPPGVEWPDAFGPAHQVVLIGVLVLAALTVIDARSQPSGARSRRSGSANAHQNEGDGGRGDRGCDGDQSRPASVRA